MEKSEKLKNVTEALSILDKRYCVVKPKIWRQTLKIKLYTL